MLVIAGLGNPGRQYMGTRHNCGFMALDILGRRHGIGYPDDGFKAMYGKGRIAGESVILLKPLTYMNLSGESIRACADYFKIDVEHELLVLYDDISLKPGQLRVRAKGSAGGHNGMKSIIGMLGTEYFCRVRIGIGEKPEGWDLADHVLSHIPASEEKLMQEAFEGAADAAECWIKEGIDAAMNRFNTKSI
jgi:PTH1 family peptidyl-tRNA hydrolase